MRLALLALTTVVLFMSTLVATPVLPELAGQLGAGERVTAGVLSAALMTVVLLQFWTGALVDRWDRRFVLAGAALAGGLSSLGCALAGSGGGLWGSWHWLLLMRIAGGAADAVSMPALLGLVAEIGEGRRGLAFGVLRSAQGVSFLLGPAVGGALALISLRAPFIGDALLSLLASGLLFALVPPRERPGPSAEERGQHGWAQLERLKALFTDRRFYAFALLVGVNNASFPVLAAFVPIRARDLGAEPQQISLLLIAEAACFALASWLVGWASDRWGRRSLAVLAQPGIIAACTGLALAQRWQWMIPWYALYGLASGTTFLLGLVMAADVTPAADAAGTLGAFDAGVDLLIFIAPVLAMALHRALSGYSGSAQASVSLLLALASLPALVALPVALGLRETRESLAMES